MKKTNLGILGGGQLGSMLCMAAKKLDVYTIVWSDDPMSPAKKFSDEFILSNLKKKKSRLVKAPSVKDSPVNLECKLVKTIKLKSNSKKISTMIIGEVIGIFINNKFIKNNRVDSVAMRYIARMGYSEYTTISSKFNLKR